MKPKIVHKCIVNERALGVFKMATFGLNYGLETADEAFASCPQVVLRYFGPFPAKRCLEF
jgi:hypothetical protein